MRAIPRRVWMLIDLDPEGHLWMEYFATRREAREACARANAIAGYEPTCRVVSYRADLPETSPDE